MHQPAGSAKCTECGYNLTGNVGGICPECGTPIAGWPIMHYSEWNTADMPDRASGREVPIVGRWHSLVAESPALYRAAGERVQGLEPTPQLRPGEFEIAMDAFATTGPLGRQDCQVDICRTKEGYDVRSTRWPEAHAVEFYTFTPDVLRNAFDRLLREEENAASVSRDSRGGVSGTKWVALVLTLGLGLATWPQIAPPDADLPPCHMFVLILVSGMWAAYLFHADQRRRKHRVESHND